MCDGEAGIVDARFTQRYHQRSSEPVTVPWWECSICGGWFGFPHPTPEQIERNWQSTSYNNPADEQRMAQFKAELDDKLLQALERHVPRKGTLLDYGSNFGRFLEQARTRGWVGIGADAFATGVEATRRKGFTTHLVWQLEDLDLPEAALDAIVSNDVFYYVWHPYRHLQRAFALLRPGGALIMRTSNKRFVEGVLRATTRGARRDRMLSRMLQGQFHSMTVHTLRRVLERIGFHVVDVQSGATSAPSSHYRPASRAAYRLAVLLDQLTDGAVNISPGVCVVAVRMPERRVEHG